jgi:hypothetical protein
VKQRIEEGLKNKSSFFQGTVDEVRYTHPADAVIDTVMLDISVKFCDANLSLINKMTTEHVARWGVIKPDESWLQICVIVRPVFR